MTGVFLALALLSLLVGFGGVYLALIPSTPVSWLWVHARFRRPTAWALFIGASLWATISAARGDQLETADLVALGLMGCGVILAHRLHQDSVFRAVSNPHMAADPLSLPLRDDQQLALLEVNGETHAFPLDFVIHHHVVNDLIGGRLMALTYCAMCRTILAFDVTDIGPLYVGSFKNANMIVADRRTGTFFQQATFQSLIGPLHPSGLTLAVCQTLPWRAVRGLRPLPQIAQVTSADLRAFELPIPGLWRRIVGGDVTPGLARNRHDQRFAARTRVIGLTTAKGQPIAVLKSEVLKSGLVELPEEGIVLIAHGQSVNGFFLDDLDAVLRLRLEPDGMVNDPLSHTTWDPRGKHVAGPNNRDLRPVPVSDEYWFSWRYFHANGRVVSASTVTTPGGAGSHSE